MPDPEMPPQPGETPPQSRVRATLGTLVGPVAAHDLPRHAAALTYFLVLAVFPVLIVVTAILGAIGLTPAAVHQLLDAVAQTRSQWAVDFVQSVLDSILNNSGTPVLLSIGVVIALWTTSSYVAAFMWAAGEVSGKPDARSGLRHLLLRLRLALLLAVLLAAAAVVVAFAGPFAEWLGRLFGIGESVVRFWTIAEWPFFFALATAVFLLLYRAAPHSGRRRVLHDLAGAGVAVVAWLAASAVFSAYLAHFGSYNRVYGVLGTAIALLVWAWILNLTLLGGLEVSVALGGGGRDAKTEDAGGS
ncbi:MAG TPA: YihY/virulence factor BrkB family protein [Thermoleophilia bacterium]|nr:YihY/virulence factor BrkB family protein [Thermoleophilia bacterium]